MQDMNNIEGGRQRSFKMRVPHAIADYKCGATFGLKNRLKDSTFNVEGNRVEVIERGQAIEISLRDDSNDPSKERT